MKKREEGITIIALAITIIVLLILSSVSLSMIKDKKGPIKEAYQTTDNAQRESIIQKIEADLYTEKVKTGETPNKAKLKEIIQKNEYNTGELGEDSFITKDGGYEIQYSEILGWQNKAADVVEVGDYVEYDPTKSDVNKTVSVEDTKLTYISEIGTATEHGNGQSIQTFKATADTKWRVMNVDKQTGKIELVAENVITKTESEDSGNFVLNAGIGYLYAEQELNEICKIFGYGYGADTNQTIEYTIGGPGEEKNGKIKGTGARSITVEDINKVAGVEDYSEINANYGNETNPTVDIFYPSINGENATGESKTAGVKNLKITYYEYQYSRISTDNKIRDVLFNGEYWLASRCVETANAWTEFHIRCVTTYGVTYRNLSRGYCGWINKYSHDTFAVRPVVTLNSSIQVEKLEGSSNTWILK